MGQNTPFGSTLTANYTSFSSTGTATFTNSTNGIKASGGVTIGTFDLGSVNGTVTASAGLQINGIFQAGTATITRTNHYGVLINSANEFGNAGNVTNKWGIYQIGTSDYNILQGNTKIGYTNNTISYMLDVNGTGNFAGALTGTSATFSNVVQLSGLKIPSTNFTFAASEDNFTHNRIFLGMDYQTSPAGQLMTYLQSGDNDYNDGVQIRPYAGSFSSALVTVYNNGNVLIGTTTDAGYKLDVNGTGRFSGDVSIIDANPIIHIQRSNNATTPAARINFETSQGTVRWQLATNQSSGPGFEINQGDGTNRALYINTDNSATFSSSVTANGTLITTSNTGVIFDNGATQVGAIGTSSWALGSGGSDLGILAVNGFRIAVNNSGTASFTMATSGAATFSSSVTATSMISGGSNKFVKIGNTAGIYTTSTYFTDLVSLDATVLLSRSDGIYTGGIFTYESSTVDNVGIVSNGAIKMVVNGSPDRGMIISPSGNVLIGTTTDNGSKLQVNGSATVSSNITLAATSVISYTGQDVSIRQSSNTWGLYNAGGTTAILTSNTGSGALYVNSLGTGTVYSNSGTLTNTNPSDSSLKNTIQPLTYGLNEILQLQPKTFYYNSDTSKASLKYGFIAQDVQKIMPDMVRKLDSSDKLGLESDGIYVTLVNAIKELQQQILDLKAQLNKNQ